jgi:hypothetical protein
VNPRERQTLIVFLWESAACGYLFAAYSWREALAFSIVGAALYARLRLGGLRVNPLERE